MQKYILFAFILGFAMAGCEVKYNDFKASSGEADFSNFVAVGDSYTAGYTDGALGRRGQLSSFPNILAGQLAAVGNAGFNQPLVKSDGSIGSTGYGYYELQVVSESLTPVPGEGDVSILAEGVYDTENPVQNLGVPGAKSFHMLADGYATLNPFFARFASETTTSVLADALALNPSFVSLWIGGNDVLTYALAGGESDAITSAVEFETYMNMIAGSLFSGNTKGVIANVPNIESLPYFSYILADGHLPLLIADESAQGGIRRLVEGEKILLGASSLLQQGYGQAVEMPLPASLVLDAEELADINEAIDDYNQIIEAISEQYGLALVDMNSVLNDIDTSGLLLDGNQYTSTFVSGGIFSLDGIHATERGSAIIANYFIEAINTTYHSNIPQVDINVYSTVVYP